MNVKHQTAVAILNWNGKKLLQEFLPSVLQYTPDAEIYVIDNASTDDSVQFLKKQFPRVKIIKLTKNLGYAGGYNKAIKYLKEEYLVLLNNDVQVTKDWLNPLIKSLDNTPKLAAIQPKIKAYNQPEYFEYAGAAGGFIDKFGYPFCRGRIFDQLEKDLGQYNDDCSIFWASGACFAVKREVFLNLGGFDEDYFAHQEEIDLCWRFKNFGFEVAYTSSSEVFHLGGGSLNKLNPKKTFLNFRNSLFNLLKNAQNYTLGLLIQRLILDLLAFLKFLFSLQPKHALSVIKAYFSFIRNYAKIKRKRREVFSKQSYFLINSIVWEKYILKHTNFKDLNSKKC